MNKEWEPEWFTDAGRATRTGEFVQVFRDARLRRHRNRKRHRLQTVLIERHHRSER
jgi:hypothetical protein